MRILTSLAAAPLLCALLAGPVAAQVPPDLVPYATAQQRVPLAGGRHINLVCEGQGSPTVVLTAGAAGWSPAWRAVQGPLARKTRVCAWDRAGFGFSDASPQAQTSANMADDLFAALAGAGIAAPYIMVAHSAGAYEAVAFAQRHRAQVAGMVLVDPSLPDMINRVQAVSPLAATALRADLAAHTSAYHRCAADPAHTTPADANICFHTPDYATPLADRFEAGNHDPATLTTRASQYEQLEPNALAFPANADFGDMPLTVLTSEQEPLNVLPVEQPAMKAGLDSLWNSSHDAIAKWSRRGSNSVVAGSPHQIPLEKPEAVISAITRMVDTLR
jgi:pimeloyl-ACP methyl ester carboxylesterase